MNYQTLKVEYKDQKNYVNMKEIGSLDDLRQTIRKSFARLPLQFDVYLQEDQELRLTEEMLATIREIQLNDFALVIKESFRDVEIESIASEISKVEIMDRSIREVSFEKEEEKIYHIQLENESNAAIKRQQLSFEKQKKKSNEVLNEDVQCNGCFAFPIKGVIYKCLVCQDYDLCSKCEETKHSFHPLLKVANKDQYPLKVKVAFSNNSKKTMEKFAEIDKIQEEKQKKAKYHPQVQDYRVVDPRSLKSKNVVAKNFFSELVDNRFS